MEDRADDEVEVRRDPLGTTNRFETFGLAYMAVAGILARMASNWPLDTTNCLLIAELQRDARLSLAELGRRVGLSSPAVAERLQRLEQSGTITGYHAEVDPRALGLALSAIIRIRPSPGQIQNVAELARETPEVVECHRVTATTATSCAPTCATCCTSRR